MTTPMGRQHEQTATPRAQLDSPPRRYRCRPILDGLPNYQGWSVEELRAFAAQMQVPNAALKSRSELLRMFDVSAR